MRMHIASCFHLGRSFIYPSLNFPSHWEVIIILDLPPDVFMTLFILIHSSLFVLETLPNATSASPVRCFIIFSVVTSCTLAKLSSRVRMWCSETTMSWFSRGLIGFSHCDTLHSVSTILWHCAASSVVSNSCDPVDRRPPGSSVHRDSPGKNTGVGCHFLLQGILPMQQLNSRLLCLRHSRADSLPLSHLAD